MLMNWIKKLFERKDETPQEVTTGRFEIEQDGHVAYLEYTIAGKILGLIHTEVPKELRNRGLASELTKTALQFARDHRMKVDVVCPQVSGYLERHKEDSDLLLR
jgi:predicted GNAT family acetyltransferase